MLRATDAIFHFADKHGLLDPSATPSPARLPPGALEAATELVPSCS